MTHYIITSPSDVSVTYLLLPYEYLVHLLVQGLVVVAPLTKVGLIRNPHLMM